jgi:hypothetical protein
MDTIEIQKNDDASYHMRVNGVRIVDFPVKKDEQLPGVLLKAANAIILWDVKKEN